MTNSGQTDASDVLRRFESNLIKTDNLQEEVGSTAAKVRARNQLRVGRDRSWIAITIIVTYSITIGGGIGFVLFASPGCAGVDCAQANTLWTSKAEMIQELIVTAVLPIVTLMLGFYFGTETAKASGVDTDKQADN